MRYPGGQGGRWALRKYPPGKGIYYLPLPWRACGTASFLSDCIFPSRVDFASMQAATSNGDPPVGALHLSDRAIAGALGVSPTTIGIWRKQGCPNTSLPSARAWMEANRPRIGRYQAPLQEELVRPRVSALPDNEDIYALVERLRRSEREIALEINDWLSLLPELAKQRGNKGKEALDADRKTAIIGHRVMLLRQEQRKAIQAILDGEGAIVKLERARGALISLDQAKNLVSTALMPAIIAIKRMPSSAESEREKARLSALAESLLATLRDSACESVEAKPNGERD